MERSLVDAMQVLNIDRYRLKERGWGWGITRIREGKAGTWPVEIDKVSVYVRPRRDVTRILGVLSSGSLGKKKRKGGG